MITINRVRHAQDVAYMTLPGLQNKVTLPKINKNHPDYIVSQVGEFYSVSLKDMKSARRFRRIVHPRQIAMYLCRRHTDLSFKQIATLLGLSDHSTVMHGVKKIEELCKNEKFKQQIEGIL